MGEIKTLEMFLKDRNNQGRKRFKKINTSESETE